MNFSGDITGCVVPSRHSACATINAFHKRRLTDRGNRITASSLSLGYDSGAHFLRCVDDPNAGFTEPTQNRLFLGTTEQA